MKIVKPSYEILTPISEGGIQELKHIERIGRVCYKSEDRITEDGESAKKFVKMLIDRSHEAILEHSALSVMFTVDRGVTHEMVRHRIASFAQESTRYCNYNLGKFGTNITVVIPTEFISDNSLFVRKNGELVTDLITTAFIEDALASKNVYDLDEDLKNNYLNQYYWAKGCLEAEENYMHMVGYYNAKPQLARSVLPNSTKANITITANYREFRNIFDLRCDSYAHPDIQYVMKKLLVEVHDKIPVVFDDLYEKHIVK